MKTGRLYYTSFSGQRDSRGFLLQADYRLSRPNHLSVANRLGWLVDYVFRANCAVNISADRTVTDQRDQQVLARVRAAAKVVPFVGDDEILLPDPLEPHMVHLHPGDQVLQAIFEGDELAGFNLYNVEWAR